MNSMTGFGRAAGMVGAHALAVRVNSVNRRGLDLSVSLPDAWETLEGAVAAAVRNVVARGKVHVVVEAEASPAAREWDEQAVVATLERLAALARARRIPFQPGAELLWQLVRDQGGDAHLPPAEAAWPEVERVLALALRGLAVMRAKEGEALLVDFLGRMERLHAAVEAIAQRAPHVSGTYRELLLQRLRQAGLELDVGDERVLKEIALFADRCDVTEELTRLRSHLAQLRELLRAEGEIGRKAEFLLQEIGREIHTIGGKANDLPIAQRVIEFKNELERVREQVANVE